MVHGNLKQTRQGVILHVNFPWSYLVTRYLVISDVITGDYRIFVMKGFMISTLHQAP
jgi:hypothetical protein